MPSFREMQAAAQMLLLVALVHPEPDTKCDVCWRAEAPWLARVRDSFGLFQHENQFASVGLVMLAALGGKTGTSWYDRHRTDYVQTGDPRHLARMLRHVEKP